eukprot:jgi/Chrzof1/1862/Cz10g24030.t1
MKPSVKRISRQKPQGRSRCSWTCNSQQATQLLQQANEKYNSKDMMGALKLYEDVIQQANVEATTRQKQAALYSATAIHAYFGDVELAQITLREAIRQGLDFEQAIQDPELVDIISSPQILIQLKRFNQTAQNALAARGRSKPGGSSSGSTARSSSPLDQDLSSILGSATSDQSDIDMSVGGVIKRVALVLAAGIGLGVALFYLGLEYAFPKY